MRNRDLTARDVGRRRSDVRVVAVRVVRKTLFAPGKGGQFLFSDGHVGDNRLSHDIHEGTFNARRPGGNVGCEDGVHVFRLDPRWFCHCVQYAELPRRDVVGAVRH